ncbi:hypothetical protein MIND_00692800 [Mycena indigotica]|uniref:S-adenosylmethionine-dependent methyltransferase n=1 Tax=Mycena indigotica TaxID=2126181 RepID=A0A8H6SL03_9AGAR|nr:uncharacterized protein MIND_00692800 [Mycena indigotica]KAF7301279.1 hypothetical protein MIND_00692800 [Mycena indigotica]
MAPITPSSLPPLRSLAKFSPEEISREIQKICELYWPSTPPLLTGLSITKRKPHRPPFGEFTIPDSGYASAVVSDDESDEEDGHSESSDVIDGLRADPFERTFAVQWLTGFIRRIDDLFLDEDPREHLLDQASALLARFTHQDDAEEPDITRVFTFPVANGSSLQIELNDAALSSSDHTSVGLQSWGSAIVFAERLCADPTSFGLIDTELRVLELGAGTGLLSIAAAKLLPRALVVATDYHPAILANLASNVRTNSERIRVAALDWSKPSYDPPLDQVFDVILAADVVYHPDHARWLRACVTRLLSPQGRFHLIVPVRTSGRHEGVDRTIDEVFGNSRVPVDVIESGHRLAILEATEVGRQGGGVGRADESGYRLFNIGWVPCSI